MNKEEILYGWKRPICKSGGGTVGLTVTTGVELYLSIDKKERKYFLFLVHHLLIVEAGKFLGPYPI